MLAEIPQIVDDSFAPEVLRRAQERGLHLTIRTRADYAIPRGIWGGISIAETLTGAHTPASTGLVTGY